MNDLIAVIRIVSRIALAAAVITQAVPVFGHGTAVFPASRVRRVFESNPENPNFELARNAVQMDGTLSYYTWNELSRNIPEAVQDGLPEKFDYSPWVPDGQLASAGRIATGPEIPRTYRGLDQVSTDWPTTPVTAGETLTVDFLATAPHDPSVWDVWMTTPDWDASTALNWDQMQFLDRPQATLVDGHYFFDITIPSDLSGHHVLWIAWQRDDPAGEVFISTSDLSVASLPMLGDANGDGAVTFADFAIVQNNFNTPGTFADGDFNDDGFVTFADFAILQNAFDGPASVRLSRETAGTLVAPESATIVCLGVSVSCLLLVRRR